MLPRDLSVTLSRGDRGMPENLLHHPDVRAVRSSSVATVCRSIWGVTLLVTPAASAVFVITRATPWVEIHSPEVLRSNPS
jgi:hypothetical protein